MNIKQLKVMIADLPDHMPVVECRAGNVGSWTGDPDLSLKTVYKFKAVRNYGLDKGSLYEVEFCERYKNNYHSMISEYSALVFYTEE